MHMESDEDVSQAQTLDGPGASPTETSRGPHPTKVLSGLGGPPYQEANEGRLNRYCT